MNIKTLIGKGVDNVLSQWLPADVLAYLFPSGSGTTQDLNARDVTANRKVRTGTVEGLASGGVAIKSPLTVRPATDSDCLVITSGPPPEIGEPTGLLTKWSKDTLNGTPVVASMNREGLLTATSFLGTGSDLTDLDASHLTRGILPNARLDPALQSSAAVPGAVRPPGELFRWTMDEGSGPYVLNAAGTPGVPNNLWPYPEQVFAGLFTLAHAGDTWTAGYAPGARRTAATAARVQFAGGNSYALAAVSYPAGNYVVSASVKSTDGTDQTIRFLWSDGVGFTWSSPITVRGADSWQRVSAPITIANGRTLAAIGPANDGTNASDVLIDEFKVESGTAATSYRVPDRSVTLIPGTSVARSALGLVFPGGAYNPGGYSFEPNGSVTLARVSVYAAVRKSGTLPFAGIAPIVNGPYPGGVGNCPLILAGMSETAAGPCFGFGTGGGQALAVADAATVLDGADHVLAGTYDGATARVYLDGYLVASTALAAGTVNLPYLLLSSIAGAASWAGTIAWVEAAAACHPPAAVRAVTAYIAGQLAGRGFSPPPARFLAVEGDSIAAGYDGTAPHRWRLIAQAAVTPAVQAWGPAVSGSIMSQMQARGAALDAAWVPGGRNVLAVGEGTNDLTAFASNADVDAWLAAAAAYCDARRAGGATKILWCTVTSRGDLSGNATLTGYWNRQNAGIRAMKGVHTDDTIDFAADPTMGSVAAALDTTLYDAGLHPTSHGHDLLGAIAAPVVAAAFA